MGDALAMALLEARGFTEEDFAISHPGGRLGRKLLVKVEDIMHSGDSIPRVTAHTSLADALVEMSRKGFGMTTVVEAEEIIGVFTDGDLRRCLDAGKRSSRDQSRRCHVGKLQTHYRQRPSSRSREYHAEVSGLCSYCHRFRSQTIRHSENA